MFNKRVKGLGYIDPKVGTIGILGAPGWVLLSKLFLGVYGSFRK